MYKLSISVADPGSSAFLTPGSGIRYPGWVKNQDPGSDPGWTSRIIFSRAYKPFFGLKSLMRMRIRDPGIFLTLDTGSRMEKIRNTAFYFLKVLFFSILKKYFDLWQSMVKFVTNYPLSPAGLPPAAQVCPAGAQEKFRISRLSHIWRIGKIFSRGTY